MKDGNKSELVARLGSRMTFGTAGKINYMQCIIKMDGLYMYMYVLFTVS